MPKIYRWSAASKKALEKIHPDLRKVVDRALEILGETDGPDIRALEGLRPYSRQLELIKSGASRTKNSRHLTGHAVDLGALENGKVVWHWPLYHKIAAAVKKSAKEMKVSIDWGGDWKTFKDGPHFELKWADYPVSEFDARKL